MAMDLSSCVCSALQGTDAWLCYFVIHCCYRREDSLCSCFPDPIPCLARGLFSPLLPSGPPPYPIPLTVHIPPPFLPRCGYVTFERKGDAAKALQQCSEQPFLIGQASVQSVKPVKVEWANLEVRSPSGRERAGQEVGWYSVEER